MASQLIRRLLAQILGGRRTSCARPGHGPTTLDHFEDALAAAWLPLLADE
jgi:hypothetical protein